MFAPEQDCAVSSELGIRECVCQSLFFITHPLTVRLAFYPPMQARSYVQIGGLYRTRKRLDHVGVYVTILGENTLSILHVMFCKPRQSLYHSPS